MKSLCTTEFRLTYLYWCTTLIVSQWVGTEDDKHVLHMEDESLPQIYGGQTTAGEAESIKIINLL